MFLYNSWLQSLEASVSIWLGFECVSISKPWCSSQPKDICAVSFFGDSTGSRTICCNELALEVLLNMKPAFLPNFIKNQFLFGMCLDTLLLFGLK
jgi:hypothetical protein